MKLNFEMEGLEASVVILIRNGGQLGSAISLGVSRATTKLVMISTDDDGILERAVAESKLKRLDIVKDGRSAYDHIKIPKDSDKARWSCIGSAFDSLHKASLPICRQISGIFSRSKQGALEKKSDVKVLIFEISGLL